MARGFLSFPQSSDLPLSLFKGLITIGCIFAARGFFEECEQWPGCGHGDNPPSLSTSPVVEATAGSSDEGYTKDRNLLVDPKSTGRKEAARKFPLDRTADCEWINKKFVAFNGKMVWGCVNGKQSNIHHGPDKDTLRNVEGNVHRICFTCHNHYHAVTDPDYDDATAVEYPLIELQDATREELVKALIERRSAKQGPRSVNPND